MSNFADIALIIWDFDGTLLDSFGVYSEVVAEAARLNGLAPPDAVTIRHNFHGSLDESIRGALNMVDGEAFATLLNDFLRIQENYYANPELHLFKDALDLVQRFAAAGKKQIIVTNRNHQGRGTASPRYIVENSSLGSHISDIVCGEDAPVRKPSAEVINFVPGVQGLAGGSILVIGDQHVDAQLAQNLKAKSIIVNRNDEPVPHLAELGIAAEHLEIVKSLSDITIN